MEASGNTQSAKESKKDAKKPAAAAEEQDLSMEEILQSIRRIIAEDDDEGKKAEKPKANGPKGKAEEENIQGSEVLELTEMLQEDGSVVDVKTGAKPEAPKDVLSAIDTALAKEKPPAPIPPKAAEPLPVAPPPPPPPVQETKPVAIPADTLLSDSAAAAASAAFNKLKSADSDRPVEVTPAPSFRSGTTVEDLVTEMLRPMMKAWLDINLPPIVERIVEREVRKLSQK